VQVRRHGGPRRRRRGGDELDLHAAAAHHDAVHGALDVFAVRAGGWIVRERHKRKLPRPARRAVQRHGDRRDVADRLERAADVVCGRAAREVAHEEVRPRLVSKARSAADH